MDDLLNEFLTESAENIAVLDVELVRLERNPNDHDLLANIFRLVHTIKGTCGFLGLPRLEAVAHASENVLGKLREHELDVTPEAVTLILESFDRIKWIMAALETSEAEPEGDDAPLIERLNAFAEGRGLDAPPPSLKIAASADGRAGALPQAGGSGPEGEEDAPMVPHVIAEAATEEFPVAVAAGPEAPAQPNAPSESGLAAQNIRVNVELLEELMNLVSELVLSRNQLLQMVRGQSDSEFAIPLQRLSHVTTDLQEGIMKTRMQPIGNAWAKLPRIVRDLAMELGKKIDLQMRGADTELDRQVLELIKDPLTHMVRNSADHGLELPAQRRAAGKSETGTITLNAYHEGGHIIIEISDDGAGIAVDKVKAKALAQGLVDESELAGMSDQQILHFVFRPGFSTAARVTSVSGRGVGMDVVRSNIERIGGTVDVRSLSGQGSTFMIKIPLTLAIVSALIVEAGGERFAMPQIAVNSLVRAATNSEHKVEYINGTPVMRLRDRLLPLVTLDAVLRLDSGADAGDDATAGEKFVVVSQVGSYSFGVIVDRVFDTEEIVVKPVAPILRHISAFSGNTILGDGSVIMILDPNGLSQATGQISIADQGEGRAAATQAGPSEERTALLVFRAGDGAAKVAPLSLVARLEEIDVKQVERSNGRLVFQYRGKLMPLIALDGTCDIKSEGRQPLLVFSDGVHFMGLIVDEIVDIVDTALDIELRSDQPGRLGSVVIHGKTAEMIDASYFLKQAQDDWFAPAHTGALGGDLENRVLLVDDSPFFRNMLKPLLISAGYRVTAAETAGQALDLREHGHSFDIIVSDIEMPGMDGFEFMAEVRRDGAWKDVPVVALSSHTAPGDLEHGRAVGFADYVAKFDREALLRTLSRTISKGNLRGAA